MGGPCLSTPAGSGDPEAAAAVSVRAALIVHTSPPSYNASRAPQDSFAPRVRCSTTATNPSQSQFVCLIFITRPTPNDSAVYLDLTGTDHYKSQACPLGYVCPVRSTRPIPCPPGSFGNVTLAATTSDCHPCPAGTFNHLPAQRACFPCGSSSTSTAGGVLSGSSESPAFPSKEVSGERRKNLC